MIAKGTFEVKMTADPPYDTAEGVSLGHVQLDKRFVGALEATSQAHMIAARTSVPASAGYVAIEHVTGVLDGKRGSFVLQHSGTVTRGVQSLLVTIVPDSGSGELAGLSGRMTIQIVESKHLYELDYALAPAA